MHEILLSSITKKAGPAPGAWRQIVTTTRIDSVGESAVVSDGQKIYICGGVGYNGNLFGRMFSYDPNTNDLVVINNRTDRLYAGRGSAYHNGSIYILPYRKSSGTSYLVEKYNLTSNTWSEDGSVDSGMFVQEAAYVTIGSKIWKLGGEWYDQPNVLMNYDVLSKIFFRSTSSIPGEAMQRLRGMAIRDDKVDIIGGMDQTNILATRMEGIINSPFTRFVNALPTMEVRRTSSSWINYGDYLYGFGGYDGNNTPVAGKVFAFNVKTKEVSIIDTKGAPSNWGGASGIVFGNKAYFFGGLINGFYTNAIWEYTFN